MGQHFIFNSSVSGIFIVPKTRFYVSNEPHKIGE